MKRCFTSLTALLCSAAILLCCLPMQALAAEYRAAVSPELAIVTCNQRETEGKKYIRRTALDTVWTVPGFVHLMTDGEMWVCDRIVSDVKY